MNANVTPVFSGRALNDGQDNTDRTQPEPDTVPPVSIRYEQVFLKTATSDCGRLTKEMHYREGELINSTSQPVLYRNR